MSIGKSQKDLDLETLDVLVYQLEKFEDERDWNLMWVKDRIAWLNNGKYLTRRERNIRIPRIQKYIQRTLTEEKEKVSTVQTNQVNQARPTPDV